MSRICWKIVSYFLPRFGKEANGDEDVSEKNKSTTSLYKRIRNVYGLRYGDCDEDEDDVILLNPTSHNVNTVSPLDVRELLRRNIAEIEENLRSQPRSNDYVEQATILIDRYKSYIEIADASELSGKVLDNSVIASLSEMSCDAFGKFAKVRKFDDVVKPNLSYVSPVLSPPQQQWQKSLLNVDSCDDKDSLTDDTDDKEKSVQRYDFSCTREKNVIKM